MRREDLERGGRPEERRIELRAGPLSMLFEPETGSLRQVRAGGREVLRGIYAAVRDRNWGTVEPRISGLRVEEGPEGFRASFEAACREGEIDFSWRGRIEGDARGTLRFSMDGEARSTFLRNRLGICVLHPLACAGAGCRVERADGGVEEGRFPLEVSPHQPFREIRAIAHQVEGGLWAEARFAGEVFEMEDHRNWTDASFKTYCTPLGLSFPVEVKAGTAIRQSVELTLRGAIPAAPAGAARRSSAVEISLEPGRPPLPLPRIGLGLASHGRPLRPREVERLRALGISHLRVDLRLDLRIEGAAWRGELRRAAEEARSLGTALEAAVFLGATDPAGAGRELAALAAELEALRPRVWAFLVFHSRERSTGERWLRLARERLSPSGGREGGLDPRALIGGGTDLYLAQLNRGRPPPGALDLACFSLNPQVHAFDDLTLVENLEGQGAAVEMARRIAGGKPVAATPVTLRPRFPADATGPAGVPRPGELPAAVDPRQMSLLGAGWTLGSLKALAGAGAASITYYETTGWRGVMEREEGPPLPERFPSVPGAVFPLYHVLADALEWRDAEVLPVRSSDPLRVEGLLLRRGGRLRLLLANLGPEEAAVAVRVPGLEAGGAGARLLDARSAGEAMSSPEAFRARQDPHTPGTILPPWSILRIEN